MLFIILILFKVHKAKEQEIKKNTFIKQEREYIIYIDRMPLQPKINKKLTE